MKMMKQIFDAIAEFIVQLMFKITIIAITIVVLSMAIISASAAVKAINELIVMF